VLGLFGINNVTPDSLLQPLTKLKDGLDKVSSSADAMGDKVALAGAKAAHGLALAALAATRNADDEEGIEYHRCAAEHVLRQRNRA
jgi:hypothetical protein